VACIPYRDSPEADDTNAIIYELQEIEITPFHDYCIEKSDSDSCSGAQPTEIFEFQIKAIINGIKKFLECGFYVASSGFDVTSNTQRRNRFQS
jgi:hypothetical protein